MTTTPRNAPCPCGSGSKYKKCCLAKDEAEARAKSPPSPKPWMFPSPPKAKPLPALSASPKADRRPPDPHVARQNATWERFKAADYDHLFALYAEAMTEPGLMDGEMAFDMLETLFRASGRRGDLLRFDEAVAALREKLPDVYRGEAKYVVQWLRESALVRADRAALATVAQEIAALAIEEPAVLDRAADSLAFHGFGRLLSAVATAAWSVADVEDPIADDRGLARRAARWMALDALERLPAGGAVVDLGGVLIGGGTVSSRIDREGLDDWLLHVSGREQLSSTLDAFQGEEAGRMLVLLGAEFVGFLRLEERVPFAVGELGMRTLMDCLARRLDELSDRPQGARQRGKRGKTPPAASPPHPLCPSHATLDRFLAGFFRAPFSREPYAAVAALAVVPAWLRFLEARGLMAADRRARALEELRPLANSVRSLVSRDEPDTALSAALSNWPALQLPGMGSAVVGDVDVDWAIAPTERAPRPPARAIDWSRALDDVPSEDFFEGVPLDGPLHIAEALDNFIFCMEEGRFREWEAVIRDEQGLPLTADHERDLEGLLNSTDDDEDERILYINDAARPTEPWFVIARKIAARLLPEAPLHTSAVYDDIVLDGWPRLRSAIVEHGTGLSLPEGAVCPLDTIPGALRHQLDIQACLEPLHGIGQGAERGAPISLADPAEVDRVDAVVDRLRQYRDSVAALDVTLDDLPRLVQLPDGEHGLLHRLLREALNLPSDQTPLATCLAEVER